MTLLTTTGPASLFLAHLVELAQLAEEARAEFQASSYHELHRVECQPKDGCLVITATVSSYYLKQMAQSLLVRRFGNAFPIVNDLQVADPAMEPLADVKRSGALMG
jgi:hypothetical protein